MIRALLAMLKWFWAVSGEGDEVKSPFTSPSRSVSPPVLVQYRIARARAFEIWAEITGCRATA
jgi:hypothetical protein